jgi:protein-disulfide isomerase
MAMDQRLTKDEKKKLRHEEWEKQLSAEQKKKKMNKIMWWAGGIVLLAFSVWFIVTLVNNPSSSSSTTALTAPGPKPTDMTYGNPKAKVVLTEYADFQCPGCGAYYPIVKQLTADYKDKLYFVYRFFPLESIHRNALASSEAGYAASKQSKFWEMHDLLFAHQTEWAELPDATNNFLSYAQQAGLNIDQFKKDFNDPATEKYVKSQEQAALDLGLPGTPTFFLNGKQIQAPGSLDGFKQLINQQLAGK